MEMLKKATIIYTDDLEEKFDAIRITNNGVVICRILDGEILECGFISKNNIKQIKNGTNTKIHKF